LAISAVITAGTMIPVAFSADKDLLPEMDRKENSSTNSKWNMDVSGQNNGMTLDSSYQLSNNLEADVSVTAILNSQVNNDILAQA